MSSGFVTFILVVGGGFMLLRIITIHRGWSNRMTHLAATRGWRADIGWFKRPSATGMVDGCRVVIEMPWRVPARHDRQPGLVAIFLKQRKSAWDFSRLTITLPRALPLRFEPESSSSIGRLLSGRDLELGDPTFDDVVRIGGNPAALRAAFDAKARWAVRLFVERGGTFDGQAMVLAWQHDGAIGRDADAIDCALEALRNLVSGVLPTPERMAQLATEDPKPGIRAGALADLLQRHRQAPATAEALQRALGDSDPAVRLVAARTLDDRAALESLVPPGVPMPVRVGAIEALGASEEGRAILRRVVARLDGEARAAAVTALRAAGDVPVGALALAEVDGGGLSLTPQGTRDGGLSSTE